MTLKIPLQPVTGKVSEKALVFSWLLLYFKGIVLPAGLTTITRVFSYPVLGFLLLYHWKKVLYAFLQDKALLILIAFSIASLTWSFEPSATLNSIRGALSTTLFGVYVASLYTPKEQLMLIFKLLFTWCLISLIIELVFPGYGVNADFWAGIFSFKYGLGFSAAMLGIFAILLRMENRISSVLSFLTVACSLLIIIFSKSGTSLMAFCVALSLLPIFYTLRVKNSKLRFLLILVTITTLLTLILVTLANRELIIVNFLGKDLTLTGRSGAWEILIRKGMEHPILGYGLAAFWYTQTAIDFAGENTFPLLPPTGTYLGGFHSHNGYIEIFLSLGFVGLLLSFLSFLMVIIRVTTLVVFKRSIESFFMFQSLIMMLISNFSEVGSILNGGNFLWFLYVIIAISSSIQLNDQSKIQPQTFLDSIDNPS
jgi:exopolysaccharide production protein ExoQ